MSKKISALAWKCALLKANDVRCLFIDLASHDGLLACVTENEAQASAPVDHRIADRELVPMMEKLLRSTVQCTSTLPPPRKVRNAYEDLTHIACVTGPGGFMSLRVGVSLANTLSHTLQIPIAGIHLSDLYAERAATLFAMASSFLWLHSTKKESLFVRSFGKDFPQWKEPTHIQLQEFLSSVAGVHEPRLRGGKIFPWVGELIPDHRKAIANLQTSRAAIHESQLRDVKEILPALLSHVPYHSSHLTPWYGRGW